MLGKRNTEKDWAVGGWRACVHPEMGWERGYHTPWDHWVFLLSQIGSTEDSALPWLCPCSPPLICKAQGSRVRTAVRNDSVQQGFVTVPGEPWPAYLVFRDFKRIQLTLWGWADQRGGVRDGTLPVYRSSREVRGGKWM